MKILLFWMNMGICFTLVGCGDGAGSGSGTTDTGTSDGGAATTLTGTSSQVVIPKSDVLSMNPSIPVNSAGSGSSVFARNVVSGCFSSPTPLTIPALDDTGCAGLLTDTDLTSSEADRAAGEVSCFKQLVRQAVDTLNAEINTPLFFLSSLRCASAEITSSFGYVDTLDLKSGLESVILRDNVGGFSISKAKIKKKSDENGLSKFKLQIEMTLPDEGELSLQAGVLINPSKTSISSGWNPYPTRESSDVQRGRLEFEQHFSGNETKLKVDYRVAASGTKHISFKTKQQTSGGESGADVESEAKQKYVETSTGSGTLKFKRKFDSDESETKHEFLASWNADGSGCAILSFKSQEDDSSIGARKKECWDENGLVSTPASEVSTESEDDIEEPEEVEQESIPDDSL